MPDLDVRQILSAQVTADEDSPYYQCEIELRDPKDYRLFVRDDPFILHLFDHDYHFVVDSKRLSRSIDDQGNLQESVTISGLSPLCLKSNPRASTITKVWDTATYAKAIVEELLGSISWEMMDWLIPAYRLSAENADPLSIANQVVNAIGGLIESNPDGSIRARYRWPTSIVELDTNSAEIFDETIIYSLSESPTQDELINRIRIYDSNAGYQDRMEYTQNLINPDEYQAGADPKYDSWNGMLYAYPSPWRDGLSVVTTRFSKVFLGELSEGTQTIPDPNDRESEAEIITFENGQGSTQYPIMSITSFEWLDEDLGAITFTPYSTTLEVSQPGRWQGHSLAKIEYITRFLSAPVHCTESQESITAQCLLLENRNGE